MEAQETTAALTEELPVVSSAAATAAVPALHGRPTAPAAGAACAWLAPYRAPEYHRAARAADGR